ncbi:MAG: ATP-dependent zinc metalloprotease FtsH [Acidimicrobiia bacterium]|nr:ATP-dependent zinc metalloprotease FtsH [Acidimicrobiia bacterium]
MWAVGLVFLAIIAFSFFARTETGTSLPTDQFFSALENKQVVSVEIDTATGNASGKYRPKAESDQAEAFTTTVNLNDQSLDQKLAESGAEYEYKAPSNNNALLNVLFFLLPFLLIILVMVWVNRRAQGQMGSIMQIGRSRAKVYTTEKPKTTFGDVAGHEAPKQEIKEVVSFLKEPRKFKELGAKVPKGVLLVGPPGTGKTLLARAVAGEAGVPFVAVTGSDFMEMFVGVGAARVRDLFQTARKQAPAVIFIDEIDSIGRKRGAGLGGGHDEREQTLNQLLSEMDGFEGAEGIVMMAATNRPDILDPALLRPGRFDRQIVVPLPTQTERLAILEVHTKDKKLSPEVDLTILARGTPGFSGADLANLTNEAALHAVRNGHTLIFAEDFDSARDRIMMGIKRDSLAMSDEEKRVTAYHESGHAICAALTPEADEIHKVTILPVGMALGVTQFLPEERHSETRDRIEAHLVVAMGGRVAEEIVYDIPSTGAQNDLQQATKIARKMVKEWGMSDKLGPVSYSGDSEMVFLGDEIARGHEYSEETARIIDEEITRIVNDARRQATHLLTQNRAALDLVATTLLERESIPGEDVHRLIRVARGELPPQAATTPVAEPAGPGTEAVAPAPAAETVQKPGFLPPPMTPGVAH